MPKGPLSIWLYRNIITSQVILSASKVLKNGKSMAQLPPNRRLHPTALRKDHWQPMLQASFASTDILRQVYSRLMEYRMHRRNAPDSRTEKTMPVAARNRAQMNQVATTVADLAAACEAYGKSGVTIDWVNEEEKAYARTWPATVTHQGGLELKRGFEVVTGPRHITQELLDK